MDEEYKQKEKTFQQPIYISKIIAMTMEMLENEKAMDPFLPEMPELFIENNITSLLMNVGIDIIGRPSHDNKTIEEVASEVLKEIIEKLYNMGDERGVEFENNTIDLDKATGVEIKDVVKEEAAYFKSVNGYTHPERRFQPPRDIPGVITLTRDLLMEEKRTNPFLPQMPAHFFEKYIDAMLKKIDQSLYRNRCPRLREMQNAEIASKLLDEAIEKLYNSEVDIEDGTKKLDKATVDFKDILLDEVHQHEGKTNNEILAKKKKWSFRGFLGHFIPCINQRED